MRVTRRVKQVAWTASIMIGVAIFLIGFSLTYPNRPIEVVNWTSPTTIEDFSDASAWSPDLIEGIGEGRYGIGTTKITLYTPRELTKYGNFTKVPFKDGTRFIFSNETVTIYGNYTTRRSGNYTTFSYGNYTSYPIGGGDIWVLCNSTAKESVIFKRSLSIDPRRYPYLAADFYTSRNAFFKIYVKDDGGNIGHVLAVANQSSRTTRIMNLRPYTNRTITEIWIGLEDSPNAYASGEARVHIECITVFRSLALISWDDLAIVGLVASLSAPSIAYYLDNRRKYSIDNHIPDLLRNIAEAGRTGMTLNRAIEVSARQDYGPLTEELRKMVAQLSWKTPLDHALRGLADRCQTTLGYRATLLIQEAAKTGGDIQASIETANSHIQTIQNLDRKRKSQIRPYIAVMYISFFVFLLTVYILITSFFAFITKPGVTGFLTTQIALEEYARIFLYMAVIEGFFGGVTAGKMSVGSIRDGLKHSTILIAVSFIVFNFFI